MSHGDIDLPKAVRAYRDGQWKVLHTVEGAIDWIQALPEQVRSKELWRNAEEALHQVIDSWPVADLD
jgi:hypothetical protein